MMHMKTALRFLLNTAVCLAVIGAPDSVNAGSGFQPPEPLLRAKQKRLPFAPRRMSFGDTHVFVSGDDQKPGRSSTIVKLETVELGTVRRAKLDISIQELKVKPDGSAVFALGNGPDGSVLTILDGNLQPLSNLVLDKEPGPGSEQPVLSMTSDGKLVISGLRETVLFVDVSDLKSPKLSRFNRKLIDQSNVSAAWYSKRDNVLFYNESNAKALVAVDVKSAQRRSEIRNSYSSFDKGQAARRFSIHAMLGDGPCIPGKNSVFLIAEGGRNSLAYAEYDTRFRALRMLSKVSSSRPGGRQPLIAGSCNLRMIWHGSQSSSQVTQYSLNGSSKSKTIEKVGSVNLGFVPTAFAVSRDGAAAFAVSQRARSIVRFAERARGGRTRVIGDPVVREVQRLLIERGYPVGSIDGILGPSTKEGIALFGKSRGADINPEKDIRGVLEQLQNMK